MGRVSRWVRKELRELVAPFLFFLVWFHLLDLTRAFVLGDYTFTALRSVAATLGALTVGKAVLLVDALPLARAFDGRPLVFGIAWKSLLFGVVTIALHVLEELIPQIVKDGGTAGAVRFLVAEFSWPHFWVLQVWLWLAVVLYTTVAELVHHFGAEEVEAALFREGSPTR